MTENEKQRIVEYKKDYYIQKRISSFYYYFLNYYFFITFAGFLIIALGVCLALFHLDLTKEYLEKGIEFLQNKTSLIE